MKKLLMMLFPNKKPSIKTTKNIKFEDDLIDFHNPNLSAHFAVQRVL